MKRKLLASILVVAALMLASCGRGGAEPSYADEGAAGAYESLYAEAQDAESPEPEAQEPEYPEDDPPADPTGALPPTPTPLSELTTAHFLEDLDYMLYALENNFGAFDVAYWARGVDNYAIVENLRTEILANPDMDVGRFRDVLSLHFVPLVNIGHFEFIAPIFHYNVINAFAGYFRPSTVERMREPHVIAFFEPRYPGAIAEDTESDALELIAELLRSLTEQEIYSMFSPTITRARFHGSDELADNLLHALLTVDMAEFPHLFAYANEIFANAPNVTTRILEEGRVGYIAINSFLDYPPSRAEQEQIDIFYEEIRHFDHLIIDLRLNGGGGPVWFYRTLVGPNIDRRITVDGFAFLSYGEYAAPYSNVHFGFPLLLHELSSRDMQRRTVAEILESYDLPELNMADMERMDYGFRTQVVINPVAGPSGRATDITFPGKIWFLTGPYMGSGTQVSAWVVRESGFATLVGEITGGNFGGPRTLIALPNSGIAFQIDLFYLTDSRGRPLEAGTIPHIFNRDGMDALETVLALIAEGEY